MRQCAILCTGTSSSIVTGGCRTIPDDPISGLQYLEYRSAVQFPLFLSFQACCTKHRRKSARPCTLGRRICTAVIMLLSHVLSTKALPCRACLPRSRASPAPPRPVVEAVQRQSRVQLHGQTRRSRYFVRVEKVSGGGGGGGVLTPDICPSLFSSISSFLLM